MKIAVLGGGNGGYAAAADLSEQGHEVRWWRRDTQAFAPVLASPQISLRDRSGLRSVPIARPTADIGEAIDGAALVLIALPAFAQADIARAMADHLTGDQVVLLTPGTFGSVAMAMAVHAAGRSLPIFAETGTLPYLCRKQGPLEIAITTRAKRLPTGAFPASEGARAFDVVRGAFPAVEPVEDALSAALMNAGPIIHPPLILMNAGALEHFERWDIHNEGTQPSIRRVTDALDEERIALREALGYRPYHFPLRDHYTSDRWMYGAAHQMLTGSGHWREHIGLTEHRYMREDIVYGLAFMVSVATWCNVSVPVAEGLLSIAGAVCGADLARGLRTLAGLGLAGRSREELRRLLQNGLAATPASSGTPC